MVVNVLANSGRFMMEPSAGSSPDDENTVDNTGSTTSHDFVGWIECSEA
jgi:hypothetical protein